MILTSIHSMVVSGLYEESNKMTRILLLGTRVIAINIPLNLTTVLKQSFAGETFAH